MPSPSAPEPATSAGAPAIAGRVVRWQRVHGRRALPWQATRDPYRVWLSEVMLQQTQVATVLNYYPRFLERFPDVRSLADAPLDDVLALWSGLGYYSRGRNLHACAREVVQRFGGSLPSSAAELATLPGIGRSTAAAIAAFCFGERVAILDGNVKRVLARVLAFEADLAQPANERALWQVAQALVPARKADMPAYTQGLMDLGATVCTARRPTCLLCPLRTLCAAARTGAPERFPVKRQRRVRGEEPLWLLLAMRADGAAWLQRRPDAGIWAGLYCLPVFASPEPLMAALPASVRVGAAEWPPLRHALTHKDLMLNVVHASLGARMKPGVPGDWHAPARWASLGLPAPVRKLLAAGSGADAA